jgi:hypothetical protein
MIVTCIRCNEEFKSHHSHTHVCPHCNFVFSADDLKKKGKLGIVSALEFTRQKSGTHRLHEEDAARCSAHPDVDAIGVCLDCGRDVCYACAVETSNGRYCDICADVSATAQSVEYPARGVPEPSRKVDKEKLSPADHEAARGADEGAWTDYIIPWDHRRRIGRQRALFRTWRTMMLSPLRFFSEVHPGGGYFGPLLYGTVWILLGLAGGFAWRFAARLYPQAVSLFDGESIEILLKLSPANAPIVVAVVVAPIVVMIALAAICVVFHILVMIFARKHAGFRATLRVACYSAGACAFYCVPSVGGIVAGVCQFLMVATGFRQAHRMSLVSAAAAAFLPCALLLVAGAAFTYWTVAGTPLDFASLIAERLPFLGE